MRLFLVFALAFFLTPSLAGAQFFTPTLTSSAEIQFIPRAPAPGEVLTIRAVNVIDQDTVMFRWVINGEVIAEGEGIHTVALIAPPIGEDLTVSVAIGGRVPTTVSRTLTTSEVTLVFEGNTTVPPFYTGKPPVNAEGRVTIHALPHMVVAGQRISASDLAYEWYIDERRAPARRGRGINTLSLTPPVFGSDFSVRVVVSSPDGSTVTEEIIIITPEPPEILVYEKKPLSGIRFEKEIGDSHALRDEEVTFVSFLLGGLFNPTVGWFLNNESVTSNESSPHQITFRREGEGSGSYRVGVSFSHPNSLFNRSSDNFMLSF